MFVLPRSATKVVKICQAPTAAHAAVVLKVTGRAVLTSMNVPTTSVACMQTV